MNRNDSLQRGFTLLEVLVALGIVAVALGAIIKATAESASNVAYLRDKTLASWVALNQLNRTLLSKEKPSEGGEKSTSSGKVEMAGREWRWELQNSETSDPDLRRLEVSVRGQDSANPLVTLVAFKDFRTRPLNRTVQPAAGQILPGNSGAKPILPGSSGAKPGQKKQQ
jgi:general secretion pathway protein I